MNELMDADEWRQHSARVTRDMTDFVQPFAAPISMSEENGFGTAWGSGTYFNGSNDTWLLTAEHVISNVPTGGRLAHLPVDGGDYNAAFGKPEVAKWPIDAAGLPIYPDQKFLPPPHRVLGPSAIASRFAPVNEELFFIYGFPGYSVERNDPRHPDKLIVSRFNHLTIRGKPFLTQVLPSTERIRAENFDPAYHVAIHYPQVGTSSSTGDVSPLPNAAGMSGCALWDTKFIACASQGLPWRPSFAQICGVVWAVLDDPEVIFATKIEHVRAALPAIF